VISIKEIETLASMPSKEEIYSKLLFLINSPAQRLATVIGATGRDLAIVVNQGVKENKFKGGAEAPAPVAQGEEVAAAQ
jgi:large subunit ribosomal protein L10